MSGHADTIHSTLTRLSVGYPGPEDANKAHAALDALLAENQRLREALERGLHRLTHVDGKVLLAIYDSQVILREALAGDTE